MDETTAMKITYTTAHDDDIDTLAELRVDAMKLSLEAIGRFDPVTARTHFKDKYCATVTTKVLLSDELVGFYVLLDKGDHLFLDHIYIQPANQGLGLGGIVLDSIKDIARQKNLPIKLSALRDSASNIFYKKHDFIKTHEEEWDIYYQWDL